MSILVDRNTRLIVQGITRTEGLFHAQQMIAYGTKILAGVDPGRGGESVLDVPIFETVSHAVRETEANASILFVPAMAAAEAALEAVSSGVRLVVIATDGVPALDMIRVVWFARERGVRVIGPGSPGVISPGKGKAGIMPGHIHKEGRVGVISRSGTLTGEIVKELTLHGLGQSTCIGIGSGPVLGTTFADGLELFEEDPETDAVVMIGEVGGVDEQAAALYAATQMSKPVVGFVAGLTVPPGLRIGSAGATSAAREMAAAGIPVAERPDRISTLVKARLAERLARG